MKRPHRPPQLRIIGGTWRGRKLRFPEIETLRPTPDRVRETLFNWLAPVIEGARCLDLYAGSGALGLEALSRGAASVVMVDSDASVITRLREHVHTLQASGGRSRRPASRDTSTALYVAEIIQAEALAWLRQREISPFPPFGKGGRRRDFRYRISRSTVPPGTHRPRVRSVGKTRLAETRRDYLPGSGRGLCPAGSGELAHRQKQTGGPGRIPSGAPGRAVILQPLVQRVFYP